MPGWRPLVQNIAHSVAYRLERPLDIAKARFKRRTGRMGPVLIYPYRWHGTEEDLYVKGRVLEDKGLARGTAEDSVWQNMKAMWWRFESDEVAGVRVRARFQDAEQVVTTDDEGYFDVHLKPTGPLAEDRIWHDVSLELLDEVSPGQGPVRAEGPVLVPPVDTTFGVVSDIDDTVLQTGATSLWRMFRTTVTHNAATRMPFEGVAAFYRALQEGPAGHDHNPIFYVSSSPWNLYDLLTDFLDVNGIPIGPLFLRDLGLDRHKFIKSGHHHHKLDQIERLLVTHPDLPFVLIGDSGQEDPEIYHQVVKDFPDRIRAIYIRDVTPLTRDEEIARLTEEVRRLGIDMLLVPDTVAAAEHAATKGFIDPEALPDVRAEKAKDEAA